MEAAEELELIEAAAVAKLQEELEEAGSRRL